MRPRRFAVAFLAMGVGAVVQCNRSCDNGVCTLRLDAEACYSQ